MNCQLQVPAVLLQVQEPSFTVLKIV